MGVFLNDDGGVRSFAKISPKTVSGLMPMWAESDNFGCSVAAVGDLNNDGVVDLAVGARADDNAKSVKGACGCSS